MPNGDDLPPIYLDTKLSQLSFVTRYKTTARSMYDSARLRAALTNYTTPGEVLLVNEADNVMDGSITTLYLYRDGGWKTPSTESGSQVGVTRRLALEKEWCSEGEITVSTLECGEVIWASNALKGYFPMRFDGYR